MSRKAASLKTAMSGIVLNVLIAGLGFVTQRIFIATLGVEYAGINGVFTSIVSILTLADLGVSTGVMFHLFAPLAQGDHKKVAALMHFYHKACRIIAGVILVGGLILLPFAQSFVGETSVPDNLHIVFAIFIVNAVLTYAMNYRRPLLAADQKGFVVNLAVTASTVILYGMKIVVLLVTQNFYLFVACAIVAKLIENFIIIAVVRKRYPYIGQKAELDAGTKSSFRKRMYGAVFHNAANYVVASTDSILIAQFFGVMEVGLYANYHLIINSLRQLLLQIFSAMNASLGNILVSEGAQKLYATTRNMMFFASWLYAVVAIAAYFCLTPFVRMWLGAEYILADAVVIALIIDFYMRAVRAPLNSVMVSAGIVYEDRFVPVAEVIINLVVSVVLALWIGLPGIFIGTAASNLFLHFYSFPKYAFGRVLGHKKSEYVGLFLKYATMFIVAWVVTGGVIALVHIDNNLLDFATKGLMSVVITSIIYWIVLRRSKEYRYFADLARSALGKIKKRKER